MDSPRSGEDYLPTIYIGQHETHRLTPVTDELVRHAHECNYDMLTAPLTTARFRDRVFDLLENEDPEAVLAVSPLTKDDTDFAPGELTSQLLAVASPWIDLCSRDQMVYNISRQVLHLEVAYAAFCGIANIIIPGPNLHSGSLHGDGVTQYAYTIQEILEVGSYHQVIIRLSMSDSPDRNSSLNERNLSSYARPMYDEAPKDESKSKPDAFGTWDAWNIIRSLCKYNHRIFVGLDVPRPLPLPSILARWHSEPLRLLVFSQTTFIINDYGNPVLPRVHQAFLTKFMRIRNPPWIILSDIGPLPGLANFNLYDPLGDGSYTSTISADAFPPLSDVSKESQKSSKAQKAVDPTMHLSCLRMYQRKQAPRTPLERFGAGYQDYLQAPLQPLTDNLESVTYEVFEKDPVKYDSYEEAIRKALTDWREEDKVVSGPDNKIVVAVVGAGRGPLVTRALRASEAAQVDIELWAVEKNPNACVLLERHNEQDWQGRVNLVRSDMRSWKGPHREAIQSPHGCFPGPPTTELTGMHTPIDILISELLGSFADNELSPECLDGILPLLNPSCGISIPYSYTAFLTPIAAPKLHSDIASRTANDPTAPHTPYVVMLHAIDYLSNTSNPLPSDSATSNKTPTEHKSTDPLTPKPISSNASKPSSSHATAEPLPNIQPVWSFVHGPSSFPAPSKNSHNTRQARLTFRTRDRGVCHGLAGYFETVLYPGVELSTNPLTMENKSPGMMSWFPIFFPLKTPMYLPDHGELTVTIRRCTDERKVWYEWVVESWGWNLMIGGEKKRVRLGVSEVGSSKAGGCMM